MKSLVRSLLVGVFLCTPLSLCNVPPAHATSIAQLSVAQLTDASTYIVRGTVKRVWVDTDADGIIWTRAEIAVSSVLKGPDSPAVLVVESMGGMDGDQQTIVDGMARYSPDEDVLMFLDTIHHGQDLTPVSAFEGKYTVRRAPHDDRPIVVQYTVNPLTVYDARFLPYPAPADRVYLDDMLDSVQTHLKAGWDGQPIPGISADKLRTINAPERRLR